MDITISAAVAQQAYNECDDDDFVTKLLERMEKENPVLFTGLQAILDLDPAGGIILSVTCATMYRMFEIQGNLPTVSDEVMAPVNAERQRNESAFLGSKLDELIRENPHVSAKMAVYSEAAGAIRPDLKGRTCAGALFFYLAIIGQIKANNLRDEIGDAL